MIGKTSTRAIYALLFGCVLTSLPFGFLQIDSESAVILSLQWVGRILMIPGIIVGFLVARGNVHVIHLGVMCSANALFYAALLYLLLTVWRGHDDLNREKESK